MTAKKKAARKAARKTAGRKKVVKQAPRVQKKEHHVPISGMFNDWFLDYASYVILERAVPYLDDGLKPVQRRILHAMWDMDDGRFNKVANIIGHSMQYHPHGDASIGDALIQLGQKNLLVETQGNWGNLNTGDSAAAPRYIEARLSPFAREVLFNPKTTIWKLSYDGRNREPVALPAKFPLLLAHGVEGIAVGLACKILPHNFCELIEGSIDTLRKKKTNVLPDFAGGGTADFTNYNEGMRGGRVKVRARIEKSDKKTLRISELPFGATTQSLIDSILAANDKGKLKVKRIEDNTAAEVEIMITLHPDSAEDPDKTIEALYAFTECETSISPNACVIRDGKPCFISVNEILKESAFNTKELLKRELEIRLVELMDDWHMSSLEKIFIEKRIYRKIEQCTTWDAVLKAINTGLSPYKRKLKRAITREDIVKLTEIRIKRISKYNSFKADEHIKAVNKEIKEVKGNLAQLTRYAIRYYKEILKKFGKGRERKTTISKKPFGQIEARKVTINNARLYVNRAEGFAGTSLRKDELVCECSDIDNIIGFSGEGTFLVSKIDAKKYFGKDIKHIALFEKNDEQTVYNIIYRDGLKGKVYYKRFIVSGVTREKIYPLTRGNDHSKVLYFAISDPSTAPIVEVQLKPRPKMRTKALRIDFNDAGIKSRSAVGLLVTKYPVKKVVETSREPVPGAKGPAPGRTGRSNGNGHKPDPGTKSQPARKKKTAKKTAKKAAKKTTRKRGKPGKNQMTLAF